ncbi:MAG: hypothetical protein EHM54_01530 [Nitrospiraceae bacterium]|jgi:hypothetical protein|nr:MAG: hypothetical protein EHM54_01530 [Nitrospiraceae bacterium]
MEAYRYQQFAYLVVPILLGIEFFMCARDEKKGKEEIPLGFYVLDFLGFLFMAVVPAVFIFTIWAVETKSFPGQIEPLARLDRYGVMFFFMGGWWQVYLFGALKARRMVNEEKSRMYYWVPFLALGIFISLLVLWVSPWNLKWISVAWFFLIFGSLNGLKARFKTIERTMWVLTGLTFVIENALFIFLESVI